MPQRSVPPSPQALQRSHETLELPLSPLLVGGATLLAATRLAGRSFDSLRSYFSAALGALGEPVPAALARSLDALRATALPLALLALAAALSTLLQTRGATSSGREARRAAPDGIGGLGALLLLAAGVVGAWRIADTDELGALGLSARSAIDGLTAVIIAVALLDLALRVARHRRALYRTPDEARRAQREDEGDPSLRARRRALHRALLEDELTPSAAWRVIAAETALVVVAWREGMHAPRVVLHARGGLHREVLARAAALGLPVHHRSELARRLAALPPGAALPASAWPELAALMV